jgi:hypothetical protein
VGHTGHHPATRLHGHLNRSWQIRATVIAGCIHMPGFILFHLGNNSTGCFIRLGQSFHMAHQVLLDLPFRLSEKSK